MNVGITPLYLASQQGHEAVVDALLNMDGVDLNKAMITTGATPRYIAAQQGRAAVVNRLIVYQQTQ